MNENNPPKIDRLRDTLAETCHEAWGMSRKLIDPMVDELIKVLRRKHGGDMFYVSLDAKPDRKAIKADFDGSNHGWVCKKHGISQRTLYRVLNDRSKPGE